MPSAKHNSITTKAMGLIFALFYIASIHPKMCLSVIATAAPVLALWSLPLFSFVLHSFLHCRAGDSLQYASVQDLGKCSASRGHDLRYSYVASTVRRARSQTEHNDVPWSSDTPTFELITGVHALMIEHSVFSILAALIVEMPFTLVSVYNVVQWIENDWIQSVLANEFPLINS